jgi:hypothetical protein
VMTLYSRDTPTLAVLHDSTQLTALLHTLLLHHTPHFSSSFCHSIGDTGGGGPAGGGEHSRGVAAGLQRGPGQAAAGLVLFCCLLGFRTVTPVVNCFFIVLFAISTTTYC